MSGIVHLDPKGLAPLLALGEREARVILAIFSLAPEGELTGNEIRLAKRAGLSGTRELHEVLERLATGAASKGHPVVSRDTVRRQPRVKVIGPAGLMISHPVRAARPATPPAPAVPRPTVVAGDFSSALAKKAAAVRAEHGDNLVELTEAWINHLALLAPKRELPGAMAILQWDAVADLAARYGLEAAMSALRAGLAGVKELGKRPDQYLRSVARSHYVETPSGGRRRRAIVPTAPEAEEFPL